MIIQGARIIDPKSNIDKLADVKILDGKIVEIGENLGNDENIIDAAGLVLCPGFIDMHTHMRDPGLTYKEDIETGTMAAAAGGVTTILAMPNTLPPIDTTLRFLEAKGRSRTAAHVHVIQAAAMTGGQDGDMLCDYKGLKACGCVALSDDGRAVADAGVMRDVLREANAYGLLPIAHCDDLALIRGGAMNEGETAKKLKVKGNPCVAEETIVVRDILLAESVDGRVHIAHVSSGKSVQLIREAKARGAKVTCETAPHYFSLSDAAVEQFGVDAKMNPPLRGKKDVSEIIEGIKDGTIDVIATDHAPHAAEEKNIGLEKAVSGIVGLETMLGVCIKYLVKPGHMSLQKLIELISIRPAQIFGMKDYGIQIGSVADITLFDPDEVWTVDKERFFSKGRNTPYDKEELVGKVKYTIVNGRVVYSA